MPSQTAAAPTIPEVDACQQTELTEAQCQAFKNAGLLIIRNLIKPDELQALQTETLPLVDAARARAAAMTEQPKTGAITPFRSEYVVAKSAAARRLLAHPFILRSVARIQGRDFTSTWDSMVFKSPGGGAIVPWHRDSGEVAEAAAQIFNVDFYLDRSDETNCVWGIPGSNNWPSDRARTEISRLNAEGKFLTDGAVPVPMRPGDVLLHDILTLHGSPWAQSQLRRVIYYEFRTARTLIASKTHNEKYCKRKQRMLAAIINERATDPVGAGETPCVYAPVTPAPLPAIPKDWKPSTYQYQHEDYSDVFTLA